MSVRVVDIHERFLIDNSLTIEEIRWKNYGFPSDTRVIDILPDKSRRMYVVSLESTAWSGMMNAAEFPPTAHELSAWRGETEDATAEYKNWQPVFVEVGQ